MLIIRTEHTDAFLPQNDAERVEFILEHLLEESPELLHDPPYDGIKEMIANGVARARTHGLNELGDLTAFVSLMFEISPRFDEQPQLRAVLDDAATPPEQRISKLLVPELEKAWEEAARLDDLEERTRAWFPELKDDEEEQLPMGALLDKNSADVQKTAGTLGGLNKDLALAMAQTAADVAGIVDPTPISDAVGASLSLAQGDFIGAGLSLLSMVPYAGDALGKTAKGARTIKRINGLRKSIEAAIAANKLAKKLARVKSAALLRAKRKAEAAKDAIARKLRPGCTPDFNTRLPADGAWKGGKGDSLWTPDAKTARGKEILDATGGKPVPFKEGHPDFSEFVYKDGKKVGSVEIDMVGKNSTDFAAANAKMKELYPDWPHSGNQAPKDFTWHHKEDGTTMQLVPSNINNNVPHDGGASIARDAEY